MTGRIAWKWSARMVLGLALIAVTLELAYRAVTWWVQIAPILKVDRARGWRTEANLRFQVQNDEGPYLLQFNSRGLRDREYTDAKPDGVRRILVLGGSNTVGVGVAQEDLYPEILERRLDATQVINLACFLYDPAQQYLQLIEEGIRYGPDLVIQTFTSSGDVWALRDHGQTGFPKCWVDASAAGPEPVIRAPTFPWWQKFTRHSALLRVLDSTLFGVTGQENPPSGPGIDPADREAIARLVRATRARARAANADYLALYLPLGKDGGGDMRGILRDLAARGAIELLDLTEPFEELRRQADAPALVSEEDWHLTEYCHYLVARALVDYVNARWTLGAARAAR